MDIQTLLIIIVLVLLLDYCSCSPPWRRRLVRPGTLVLGGRQGGHSTLEFRCHPERDNNNRQEDHQNCAHDLVSFFLRAAGQSQKTPTLNSAERGRNPICK